jgi:hypothetical protein
VTINKVRKLPKGRVYTCTSTSWRLRWDGVRLSIIIGVEMELDLAEIFCKHGALRTISRFASQNFPVSTPRVLKITFGKVWMMDGWALFTLFATSFGPRFCLFVFASKSELRKTPKNRWDQWIHLMLTACLPPPFDVTESDQSMIPRVVMNTEDTYFLQSSEELSQRRLYSPKEHSQGIWPHYTEYPAIRIKLLMQLLTETEEILFLLIVFGR